MQFHELLVQEFFRRLSVLVQSVALDSAAFVIYEVDMNSRSVQKWYMHGRADVTFTRRRRVAVALCGENST